MAPGGGDISAAVHPCWRTTSPNGDSENHDSGSGEQYPPARRSHVSTCRLGGCRALGWQISSGNAAMSFAASPNTPTGGRFSSRLLARSRERQCDLSLICSFAAREMHSPPGRIRSQPRRDVHGRRRRCRPVDDDVADIDADSKGDASCPRAPRQCGRTSALDPTAQATSSTTLANSTSMPSPVVLTMRPRCAGYAGSTSRDDAFSDLRCRPRLRP